MTHVMDISLIYLRLDNNIISYFLALKYSISPKVQNELISVCGEIINNRYTSRKGVAVISEPVEVCRRASFFCVVTYIYI